ncbi:unnamed protein product [Calicophoron daubneyi]|uniref:NIPSNAP domain-containing protein n=1 Tax=Calicophoron daubneyi TaxID=300641 RepID=A0AAV2TUK5_CALDB
MHTSSRLVFILPVFKNVLIRRFSVSGRNTRFNLPLYSKGAPESQSYLLSRSSSIFELQTHRVKPKYLADYLKYLEEFSKAFSGLASQARIQSRLLGSWTCEIGEQNTAYHLWEFPDGYPCFAKCQTMLADNETLLAFKQKRDRMLSSFQNQLCLPFSFWPNPEPRTEGKNVYELRSYTLKPGTMIEWGNHWIRGLRLRSRNQEAVAGLFSHIGEMHVVHHLWAYTSLEARSKSRDQTWQVNGWNECVMNTVPLIRHMTSSILRPTSTSLLQ